MYIHNVTDTTTCFEVRGVTDELPPDFLPHSALSDHCYRVTRVALFAHQGFCVYEALAHRDMITCIVSSRYSVNNGSCHYCNG